MKNMLRGMALSVIIYFVIMGITLWCVQLCGGRISDVPTDIYVGVGVVCGFMAIIINEKLD
jgi:hypothetical protein